MAATPEDSVPVIAVTAAVGAVILLFVLLCNIGKKSDNQEEESDKNEKVKESKPTKAQPQKKKTVVKTRPEKRQAFTHPWLSCTLKGHSSPILGMDFSANGKYLASCSEDRTILMWSVKEFTQKEHKSVRSNVELDHATKIKFSPDTKAFVINLYNENTLRVMRIGKKPDGSLGNINGTFDFPKKFTAEILNIGIASSGRFIMACTKDTSMYIYDLKGEVLATINTNQLTNSYGAVSPCGRFVASSGFTPDVKVWEVMFDKSGTFKEVKRAFELKGHRSGVYSFSFSSDSNRMASVSKDGTWKLWNTFIEYAKGQDAQCIQTGTYENNSGHALIALSPDARAVAIATTYTISVYNATNAQQAQVITDVHAIPITELSFDNNSKYFVSTGDKQIHVFHNIVG
ncbi:unnamed protein product, partial [Owenia fusiformis]